MPSITYKEKLIRLRARLRGILPERDMQIDCIIAAMIAGGHVLVEDYEGSGFRQLMQHFDLCIGGEAPDDFTRIDCHGDLDCGDILPLFEKNDIILLDHFNRAPRHVQVMVAQLLSDGQATFRSRSSDHPRTIVLHRASLVAARVNRHEGGTAQTVCITTRTLRTFCPGGAGRGGLEGSLPQMPAGVTNGCGRADHARTAPRSSRFERPRIARYESGRGPSRR